MSKAEKTNGGNNVKLGENEKAKEEAAQNEQMQLLEEKVKAWYPDTEEALKWIEAQKAVIEKIGEPKKLLPLVNNEGGVMGMKREEYEKLSTEQQKTVREEILNNMASWNVEKLVKDNSQKKYYHEQGEFGKLAPKVGANRETVSIEVVPEAIEWYTGNHFNAMKLVEAEKKVNKNLNHQLKIQEEYLKSKMMEMDNIQRMLKMRNLQKGLKMKTEETAQMLTDLMNEEEEEAQKTAKDMKTFMELGNVAYYLPTDEWEIVDGNTGNENGKNEESEKTPESSSSSSS